MLLIVEDNPETVTRTTLSRTSLATPAVGAPVVLSLSTYAGAIDLDLPDVHEAAPPVAAARQEVGEADLVNATEVRRLDPGAARHHAIDVESEPAHRRQRELAFEKERGVR